MLSVVVPANNEAGYIGDCLDALLRQQGTGIDNVEVIVAANACTDTTVEIANGFADRAHARGWNLTVLDIEQGGKPNALNQADQIVTGSVRIYLDADIICDLDLLSQLAAALDRSDPTYASGRLVVAEATSWTTRRYAHLWSQLPFVATGVPGAGLFAVNANGRKRWSSFPEIISDDGYVRLLFAPAERIRVASRYFWPMTEGFSRLVKVRRRQDAGMREIFQKFPDLKKNDVREPIDHVQIFLRSPLSYLVYVAVAVAVRLGGSGEQTWTRGR